MKLPIKIMLFLMTATVCLAFTQMDAVSQDMQNEKTIVQIASETSNLSTLVEAVKAAGLVETLNGSGPYTVFAPTNEAFAALPEGTLEDLMKPENKEKLKKILMNHVVSGAVMSGDLSDGQAVNTAAGSEVMVSTASDVMINNAKVVQADIEASNGVVHVINKVLVPSKDKMKDDKMKKEKKMEDTMEDSLGNQ